MLKIDVKHNVGKARYLVSYSFGDKTHKDGSEFFDIAIFRNKRAMDRFIRQLQRKGN